MELNFQELDSKTRYKLLTAAVIPRPIAFVTTRSPDGIDNAAPYSFFNVFSDDPPLLILGLQSRNNRLPKDTTNNIRQCGEFVVHLVDRPLAEAMNECSVDFPEEVSEFDVAGITRSSCRFVNVSRIEEAPIAFECRRTIMLQINENRELAIGEILYMHARDDLIDPKTLKLNLLKYNIVGRLYGDLYTPVTETFSYTRLSHSEWLKKRTT